MDAEPFLLHESSRAFLDGDPRGIQQRFQFRRDALDYLAMAGIVAGGLLLVVNLVQYMRGDGGSPEPGTASTTLGVAALVIAVGAYFVTSRHSAAAARARLISEGQVLPGTLVTCTGRDETTTEASLGEVTRSYLVSVDYRFAAPTGHEIADQAEHNRPDLRRIELPAAGAPVRVLYLDDQTYALL